MNRRTVLGTLGLILLCFSSLAQYSPIHARYYFTDPASVPQGLRLIRLTPTARYTANGTNIVSGDYLEKRATAGGSTTFSNLVPGEYLVTLFGTTTTTSFTNSFGTNISGLVNGVDYIGISTNLPDGTTAYSVAAANSTFVPKAGSSMTGPLTNNAGFYGNGANITNLTHHTFDPIFSDFWFSTSSSRIRLDTSGVFLYAAGGRLQEFMNPSGVTIMSNAFVGGTNFVNVLIASNGISGDGTSLTNLTGTQVRLPGQYDVIRDFGAVGDGRYVTGCNMQTNTFSITNASAVFSSSDLNKWILIPDANTNGQWLLGYITNVDSAFSVTTSNKAWATASGVSVLIASDDTAAFQYANNYIGTNGGGLLELRTNIYLFASPVQDTGIYTAHQNAQVTNPAVNFVGAGARSPVIKYHGSRLVTAGGEDSSPKNITAGGATIVCGLTRGPLGTNAWSMFQTENFASPFITAGSTVYSTTHFNSLGMDFENVDIRFPRDNNMRILNLRGAATARIKDVWLGLGYFPGSLANPTTFTGTNGYAIRMPGGFAFPTSQGDNVKIEGAYQGVEFNGNSTWTTLHIWDCISAIAANDGSLFDSVQHLDVLECSNILVNLTAAAAGVRVLDLGHGNFIWFTNGINGVLDNVGASALFGGWHEYRLSTTTVSYPGMDPRQFDVIINGSTITRQFYHSGIFSTNSTFKRTLMIQGVQNANGGELQMGRFDFPDIALLDWYIESGNGWHWLNNVSGTDIMNGDSSGNATVGTAGKTVTAAGSLIVTTNTGAQLPSLVGGSIVFWASNNGSLYVISANDAGTKTTNLLVAPH